MRNKLCFDYFLCIPAYLQELKMAQEHNSQAIIPGRDRWQVDGEGVASDTINCPLVRRFDIREWLSRLYCHCRNTDRTRDQGLFCRRQTQR